MKRRCLGISIVAALLLVIGAPAPSLAGGVSGVPGTVTIDDALRDSTVFTQVIVFNNTGEEVPFTFDFIGPAAAWMSVVEPDDRETPIVSALDADGSGVSALIRIDIPGDTALGDYSANFRASLAPPESSGEGMTVGLGVQIPIGVSVGGTQNIAATLLGVSLRDTEVGLPARVQIDIANDGNTTITPEFSLDILADGAPVASMTTAGVPSFAGEQRSFEVRWDTTGATPGEYVAVVGIDFGGIDLGEHELEFTLHPAGTLDRIVLLQSLVATGDALGGGLAGFTATVVNPGQADVSGTLVGELMQEGTVVSSYESQPFLIRAGQELAFPVNIEVPEDGTFVFSARFRYGDEETEPIAVEFTTVAALPGGQSGDSAAADTDSTANPIALVILALVAVGAAAAGAWWLASRRSAKQRTTIEDATGGDQQGVTGQGGLE